MNDMKIIRQLGHGGTADVYLVYDNRLKREAALKCIRKAADEKAKESLKNEARILRLLDGSGAPKLYDEGEDYMELEFVSGENLLTILSEKGRLSEKEALGYAADIIKQLENLHDRKTPVIYRDLKPSNIVVCDDGHARLIDFGAARLYGKGAKSDADNLGTVGYAAPEQYGSLGQTSPQTDIYCFGMTLLQLVTGADIKDGAVVNEIKTHGAGGISPELLELIEGCIKPDRNERFKCCAEVERALYKVPRRRLFRRTSRIVKMLMLSLVIAAVVTFVRVYCDEINLWLFETVAELEMHLPAVSERLAFARERLIQIGERMGDFLTNIFNMGGLN